MYDNKTLLIIKPDHIGDYILFRNFLLEIKNSKKFLNYKITLFLNIRVREIAEFLDSAIIDSFIWVDLEKFVRAGWYFERKIQEITLKDYDVIINAMFSYMKPVEILIAKIKSDYKILIKGSLKERPSIYEKENTSIYSQIIDLSEKQIFEFERFKIAFESIIEDSINLNRPYLDWLDTWQNNLNLKNNYCVLFIGADATYRKWSLSNYKQVIKHLLKFYNLDIIIAGGNDESKDANQLVEDFSSTRLINLTGETTLLDVISILKKAKLVISNETGAAHISTILNIPTLVISNGNDFGKFTPYPNDYKTYYKAIYPFDIDDTISYKNHLNNYYNGSRLDINIIDLNPVIKIIDSICNTHNIKKQKKKEIIELTKDVKTFCPEQSRLNYNFSFMFSSIYLNLIEIKNSSNKIIIYGNSHFGRISKYLLQSSVIGMVDKNSLMISENPNSFDIFSPKALKYFDYEKILITVLGRENEIVDYLQNELNISKDKIVTLKVSQGRYQMGC